MWVAFLCVCICVHVPVLHANKCTVEQGSITQLQEQMRGTPGTMLSLTFARSTWLVTHFVLRQHKVKNYHWHTIQYKCCWFMFCGTLTWFNNTVMLSSFRAVSHVSETVFIRMYHSSVNIMYVYLYFPAASEHPKALSPSVSLPYCQFYVNSLSLRDILF
jgi:hypothetical protein